SVICGTAAGGFTFAFVLRIAKVFTNWSDTRLMPDIVGTHFLFVALRRDPFWLLLKRQAGEVAARSHQTRDQGWSSCILLSTKKIWATGRAHPPWVAPP